MIVAEVVRCAGGYLGDDVAYAAAQAASAHIPFGDSAAAVEFGDDIQPVVDKVPHGSVFGGFGPAAKHIVLVGVDELGRGVQPLADACKLVVNVVLVLRIPEP